MKEIAEEIGLDTEKFNDCLDSGKYEEEVKSDYEVAKTVNITGTPSFVIGSPGKKPKLLKRAVPIENFESLINEFS